MSNFRLILLFVFVFFGASFNTYAEKHNVYSLQTDLCSTRKNYVYAPTAWDLAVKWAPVTDCSGLPPGQRKPWQDGREVGVINTSTGTLSTSKRYNYTQATCEPGQGYDYDNGECANKCKELEGNTHDTSWDYFKYGDSPSFCSKGCALVTTGVSLCLINGGRCTGTVKITGDTCSSDGTSPGGNIPDEVPQGCKNFDGQYLCPEDTDGDGQPNNGAPLDTDAKCGYETGDKFSCSGGSYADPDYEMTDPTKPLEPTDPAPDITQPDTPQADVEAPSDPTLQGSDAAQILLLNKQINKLLVELNKDNNANFKAVIDEMIESNEYSEAQLNAILDGTKKQIEIWEQFKEFQKTSTEDIVNAIQDSAEFDDFYHNNLMRGLGEIRDSINANGGGGSGDGEVVGAIGELTNAITQVDGTLDTTGFDYVSDHTTETLSTNMVNRLNATKDKIYDGMLDSFSSVDLSGARKPSFTLDMSGFGFGSYDLGDYVNLDYVFGFIRICMLFTAALTCRKLIFGG